MVDYQYFIIHFSFNEYRIISTYQCLFQTFLTVFLSKKITECLVCNNKVYTFVMFNTNK